jgi:hypothetical protein
MAARPPGPLQLRRPAAHRYTEADCLAGRIGAGDRVVEEDLQARPGEPLERAFEAEDQLPHRAVKVPEDGKQVVVDR